MCTLFRSILGKIITHSIQHILYLHLIVQLKYLRLSRSLYHFLITTKRSTNEQDINHILTILTYSYINMILFDIQLVCIKIQ
jgi:hypothetical protein